MSHGPLEYDIKKILQSLSLFLQDRKGNVGIKIYLNSLIKVYFNYSAWPLLTTRCQLSSGAGISSTLKWCYLKTQKMPLSSLFKNVSIFPKKFNTATFSKRMISSIMQQQCKLQPELPTKLSLFWNNWILADPVCLPKHENSLMSPMRDDLFPRVFPLWWLFHCVTCRSLVY